MNERFLMKAKHIETGNWIKGYYYKMAETTYCPIRDVPLIPVHHYILYETMTDLRLSNRMLQYEVDPDTLCQCIGVIKRRYWNWIIRCRTVGSQIR